MSPPSIGGAKRPQSRTYVRAARAPTSGGEVATAGIGVYRGAATGLALSGDEPDAVTATTPKRTTQRIARMIRTAAYATARSVPAGAQCGLINPSYNPE
ncbi:MAG: hypothetical protein AUH39_00930 [Chloroflexi bacterium 13_1_40CM_67_9]|nr:MAG: hypothetical protein AUH39_00930 [Chloroflexi bacterium 13_1_40CM_67_9]